MDPAVLLALFESSPSIRLLRSSNAPFIIDFLSSSFKAANAITIRYGELLSMLRSYIDDVREIYPDRLTNAAEIYLTDWRQDCWLLRFLEAGSNEPVFQLTSHSEQVLGFIDRALNPSASLLGTESRLQLIVGLLHELAVGASRGPDQRLAHLREQRERVQAEIDELEAGGVVERFSPAKIREQFATALSLLKQLQGDFRAVEEKFKDITREVQQRHTASVQSRGDILGFALDAEDVLKQEDQGVSFYEFVRFIISPTQREKLDRIVTELSSVEELSEHPEGLEALNRMIPSLLAEAEKVMRTNQRLTATLRRLLDERTHGERRRVARLLNEIQILMARRGGVPPRGTVGADVESKLEWSSPVARGFWSEPTRLSAVDLTELAPDEARRRSAFTALARMQRLDWKRLRSRVSKALEGRESVTLGELLAASPPSGGVVEVLGYLQIANEDHHRIDCAEVEEVVIAGALGKTLVVALPLVRFMSPPRVPR